MGFKIHEVRLCQRSKLQLRLPLLRRWLAKAVRRPGNSWGERSAFVGAAMRILPRSCNILRNRMSFHCRKYANWDHLVQLPPPPE